MQVQFASRYCDRHNISLNKYAFYANLLLDVSAGGTK